MYEGLYHIVRAGTQKTEKMFSVVVGHKLLGIGVGSFVQSSSFTKSHAAVARTRMDYDSHRPYRIIVQLQHSQEYRELDRDMFVGILLLLYSS